MVDSPVTLLPNPPPVDDLLTAEPGSLWARELYLTWSSQPSPLLRCAAVGLAARMSSATSTVTRQAVDWGYALAPAVVAGVLVEALGEATQLKGELAKLDALTDESEDDVPDELVELALSAARRWDMLECVRLPLGRRVARLGDALDALAEEYAGLGECLGAVVDLGDDERLRSGAAWDAGVWWSSMVEESTAVAEPARRAPAARARGPANRMRWLCANEGATAGGFGGTSADEEHGRFVARLADAQGPRPGRALLDFSLDATDEALANARGVLRFLVDGVACEELDFHLEGLHCESTFELDQLEEGEGRVVIEIELFL